MSALTRILIVDDEAPIRRFLKAGMPDFDWLEAENAEEGERLVAQKRPDVVLLDVGLPGRSGFDMLKSLREWSAVPVIVLSAWGQERDKVFALDGGADDYVTKPFSLNELKARIKVALRHAQSTEAGGSSSFEEAGLRIDFERRQVWLDGEEVRLTPTEYRLLSLLVQHAGMVLTHKHLIQETWGPGYEESTHTLRVHMGSIRQKLESNPSKPRFIRTETGVGYRFILQDGRS